MNSIDGLLKYGLFRNPNWWSIMWCLSSICGFKRPRGSFSISFYAHDRRDICLYERACFGSSPGFNNIIACVVFPTIWDTFCSSNGISYMRKKTWKYYRDISIENTYVIKKKKKKIKNYLSIRKKKRKYYKHFRYARTYNTRSHLKF